ncbi:unnamed protein product [Auanema sp. JU1783]|nr:unnamed protein product [Auanema sp. JU1783]
MAPVADTKAENVESMEVDDQKEKEETRDPRVVAFQKIRQHCSLLDRGLLTNHFMGRVLQVLHQTRKQLNEEVLHKLITMHNTQNTEHRDALLQWVPDGSSSNLTANTDQKMDVDQKPTKANKETFSSRESDLYLNLLVLVYLIDQEKLNEAKDAAELLISKVDQSEKRSHDPIVAKAYFYLALVHEKLGRFHELTSYFNSRLRTSTLRHLYESQATLIFTLLRCYLLNKQYISAAKLVSKVTFPENANNNDLARYLYYQGRIKALQLDYAAAAGYFLQAMRKAPQEAAIGFKQNAQKWVVVIGLLQGEIPERSTFRQPIYRKCLYPYLELTQAVRVGDLAHFNKVLDQYGTKFEKDETLTLIVRLRQNVIKTAVKQISLAYSKIAIKDIGKKLQINSDVDTEYMVAKAIATGAIDAYITSDTKDGERYMKSSETVDVYRTAEPLHHFDSRIKYCLELHNQALKALRFPAKNKIKVETIQAQREREQQELELAKELAEDDDDDF